MGFFFSGHDKHYYEVGWKKDFIEKNTPVMPISGWMGDNLLKKSDNMAWWKGQDSAMRPFDDPEICYEMVSSIGIGVLFGCFGRNIGGPGLPGALIIYQGNPSISLKGHLWSVALVTNHLPANNPGLIAI